MPFDIGYVYAPLNLKEKGTVIKVAMRTFHRVQTTEVQGDSTFAWAIYAGSGVLSNPSQIAENWRRAFFLGSLLLLLASSTSSSADGAEIATAVARGYDNLRTHQYLPPDFDNEVFDSLWTVWPEPEKSKAEKSDAATRRRLTFSYYGVIPDPSDVDGNRPALGYVVDRDGNWSMNCLACHGGKVAGQTVPGLPNSHTALQTFSEDIRAVKLNLGKALSHLDYGSIQTPLNMSDGTTNAVVFGIVLGAYRNPDMTVDLTRRLPPLLHHDVDAPPFWNVRKKSSLYIDGFAPKTARPIMQFILLPKVTPEQLTKWEPEFADILAWIESVEPPKYPFEINRDLASKGEQVFNQNCARCHGTYGPEGKYEQTTIPLDEIGTDTLRMKSLTPEHRTWMKKGWLSRFGEDHVEVDPVGYVPPPLDGIWASAPYLHNGSVPTLWHLMHSESRPAVWKRTEDGYDQNRVGLEIEHFDKVPKSITTPAQRRRYFDTSLPGKSSAGHSFPESLTEPEKRAVLEYLKTL